MKRKMRKIICRRGMRRMMIASRGVRRMVIEGNRKMVVK